MHRGKQSGPGAQLFPNHCSVLHAWLLVKTVFQSMSVIDLNSGGISFLADIAPITRKRHPCSCDTRSTEAIRIEGCVAYAVATGISGYRYRIGIQFMPFAPKRGCNKPEVFDLLVQCEKDIDADAD
jgi:hypothetical protein